MKSLIKTKAACPSLGLLMLCLVGTAAQAQSAAYTRAHTKPAMQAASPQAPVPAATYQSALGGLGQGIETQSTDWRSANDAVGQFKRGHIDLLKLENAGPAKPNVQQPQPPQPSQPRSQP